MHINYVYKITALLCISVEYIYIYRFFRTMAMFPSKEAQSVLALASSSTTPTSVGLFEAHITKTT